MQESVVVIGAGHAGAQVVVQLREQGFQGKIVLLGEEVHLPYQRPPLSKQFLKDEFEEKRLYFRPQNFYDEKNVELVLGCRVQKVDAQARLITLQDGRQFQYDQCVFALGSSPRKLEVPGAELNGIYYLRSLDDANAIKQNLSVAKKLLICGGGYIGLEIAAVAIEKQLEVTVVEMAPSLLARVAPPEIAEYYKQMHARAGVNVQTGKVVTGFEGGDRVTQVCCSDGSSYEVDMVVIGIGVVPNVFLAEQAGVAIENGIVVNNRCQTSQENIFAIGDCTVHYSDLYQRNLRLESVQNALGQAKVAASNLSGVLKYYDELPWFWSDQYGMKLQIAGLHAGYDRVVLRGDVSDAKFAYFYLKEGAIIAVYALNDPQSFMFSKKLISERVVLSAETLADTAVAIKDITS